MSAKSDAFERAAIDLIQARTALDTAPRPRARVALDRAFAHLAALAAPRIRHFIRAYRLTDVVEDAEQACMIALHRAADRYDPARARFTTYANWQIRAELQALRLRLYGDPRYAGRGALRATLSYEALTGDGIDEWLVDPAAEAATERGASDGLASRVADRLIADWAARRAAAIAEPARAAAEAALVRRQLTHVEALTERLSEADRHIVRRAFADMARRSGATPH